MSAEEARARLRELSDFAAPWAVWIAATLRLPDHIDAGATRLPELAERAHADPDALARLLRYLVARGVLTREDDGYANTEISRLLMDEAGWRQWLDLDGAPGIWAESWARLLEAVRSGSPGRGEDWYYGELARTGRAASFDSLMAVQVRANADEVAIEYDWSSVSDVVDVGGGTGTMLATLLAAHPRIRGTLFDLPQVVGSVEQVERLTIVAGNVFHDPLPSGDAYVLSQVLHGWADAGAAEILRRCVKAGRGDARVLVVESLFSEPPSADQASFDLFMFTLGGGRQRTLDDFGRLAASVGLEIRSSKPLSTGNSFIELRPPGHA
jgi:2,7-dihydroxy-5-methyl-1-naphthoate 7-O-methyltransferase